MSLQITACASWGSIERLQTLTNELLEHIESTPDVSKKAQIVLKWLLTVQMNLIEPVIHGRKEPNPIGRIVSTLQHAKDCDAKYGLLAIIRWYEMYPQDVGDEKYLGMINKIKDPQFRMCIVLR